jgi:hypothetical protein
MEQKKQHIVQTQHAPMHVKSVSAHVMDRLAAAPHHPTPPNLLHVPVAHNLHERGLVSIAPSEQFRSSSLVLIAISSSM